jgi:hypothetical protein
MSDAPDRLLSDALAARGLADPRGALRARLRALRGSPLFDRAVARYQEVLTPGIEDGTLDPVEAWVDYARLLAGDGGREVVIDVEGREGADPEDNSALLLHLPRDRSDPATPLRAPAEPSAAQAATLALLRI